jgi:hypothetical protein
MTSLLGSLFCIVAIGLPLIGGLLLLGRLFSGGQRSVNPYAPQPVAPAQPSDEVSLAASVSFDKLLVRWAAEGRLAPEAAAQVRELLAEHVGTRIAPSLAQSAQVPAMALPTPAAQLGGAPNPASVPTTRLSPEQLILPQAQPAGQPGQPVETPSAPPVSKLRASLLALDTRRLLLFLGTFLLLMSSLTLVVFNWNSLPPLVQFAILAGTVAAIWGGGTWMARQPTLEGAGRNLQIIASLLMPVVGFALGRPGLLDLAARPSWLLTSLVSLVTYIVASARTRRGFYGGASAVAAVSALLAALNLMSIDIGWQPLPVVLLLAVMLPLCSMLRARGAPGLAGGPRWVALIGAPTTAFVAVALFIAGAATAFALASTAGALALFCGLAYRLEGKRPWLWAAIGLAPATIELLFVAFEVDATARALTRSLLALLAFGLSELVADRHRPAAAPLLIVSMMLGGGALAEASEDRAAARLALPALIALGAGATALVERGRMAWLDKSRPAIATGGLAVAGLLVSWWLAEMLALTSLELPERGLALLPLAAVWFAAARWWPGSLKRSYDTTLQALGVGVALLFGVFAMFDWDTQLPAALLLTLIFGGQALLRRHWGWPVLSLGFSLLASALALEKYAPAGSLLETSALVAFTISVAYSLGGKLLRPTRLSYWAWPAVGWGAVSGLAALCFALLLVGTADAIASGVILGLGALLALHSWLWRQPMPGYGAATLFTLAGFLAGSRGFFLGWDPRSGDLAYIACGIAFALGVFSELPRRLGREYARPYLLLALIVLPMAPLAVAGAPGHLAAVWAIMALQFGLSLWRFRLPWLLALAGLALDMALFYAARWLGAERFAQAPSTWAALSGALLLTLAFIQALCGVVARRWFNPRLAWPLYSTALAAAFLAAWQAAPYAGVLAGILLAGALLTALIASVENNAPLAWTTLGLIVAGALLGHHAMDIAPSWSAAWVVLELLVVCLVGWGAVRLGLSVWRLPTSLGALGLAAVCVIATGLLFDGFPAISFALVNLGLLLATMAVREREIVYAYAAGAAFVGAALFQLADWGIREPQWYVIPAGLYLLALAAGLRRFQGQRRASQLVETAAVALLLGVTFTQAIRWDNGVFSSLLLFGESLALAAYGALGRLRVPFLGGAGFFVAGVLWMTVDRVRLANQWVLLGIVGLLMVAAYVVLERHQERLTRAGRRWAAELKRWE